MNMVSQPVRGEACNRPSLPRNQRTHGGLRQSLVIAFALSGRQHLFDAQLHVTQLGAKRDSADAQKFGRTILMAAGMPHGARHEQPVEVLQGTSVHVCFALCQSDLNNVPAAPAN